MSSKLLILLCSFLVIYPTTVTAASGCAGGIYAALASQLSAYPQAQTFCSSKYPLAPITSTISAPTRTIPTTIVTSTVLVTSDTTILTSTAPAVSESTTVSTETIIVTASTATDVVTEIVSGTEIVSSTTYVVLQKKNFVTKPASTSTKPPTTTPKTSTSTAPKGQASVWSSILSQAGAFVGSICTCLETRSTIYATVTPSTVTSATATTIVGVTQTNSATVTPTITISIVDSLTLSETVTTLETSTITSTSTSTEINVVTVVPRGPRCTDVTQPLIKGYGGCSSNCFCDRRQYDGIFGVCNDSYYCGQRCNVDTDCTSSQACVKGGWYSNCASGTSCVNFVGCSSSVTRRMLSGRRADAAAVVRKEADLQPPVDLNQPHKVPILRPTAY